LPGYSDRSLLLPGKQQAQQQSCTRSTAMHPEPPGSQHRKQVRWTGPGTL
jgi:hypothetical protein